MVAVYLVTGNVESPTNTGETTQEFVSQQEAWGLVYSSTV